MLSSIDIKHPAVIHTRGAGRNPLLHTWDGCGAGRGLLAVDLLTAREGQVAMLDHVCNLLAHGGEPAPWTPQQVSTYAAPQLGETIIS